MGKVKGKHRQDKYYHFAKEQGYRARSAWKLVQLDAKFELLRSSRSVLDLCAAPGGWMQVCVERVPVGSLVLGVDLDPIRPIRGALALQEDITTSKCRSSVKRIMLENGCSAFDLVLHDGSPNVGGAWAKEATVQNALVIDSVKLATELLAPKGNFVTKVFRSQDYTAILYCLRQLFEKVEVDKPAASRSESAEIYVIGFNYKAPSKIDPRLLDYKHLFQGGKEAPKIVDVLRGTKQKRHRDGYEDGDTTLRKLISASEFIQSEAPGDILGSVASITFNDPDSLPLKDHALTTEEIKALCDDLRVLGKQDFKYLLKWRLAMRKALSPEKATAAPSTAENEVEVDEDEKELNEMEDLSNAMERKKKRAKKIAAKREAKDKARKALGKQADAIEDGYTDMDLFSLSSIKGKKDLVVVDNNEHDDDVGEAWNSESEESHYDGEESSHGDLDSEEERQRYNEREEELIDKEYEMFLAKKGGSTKQRKRSKQDYSKDDQLEGDEDDDTLMHSDQDSDNEKGDREANPLMVPLSEDAPTQEEITAKWFSQDVFTEGDEHEKLGNDDTEDEMEIDLPAKAPKVSLKIKENAAKPPIRQKEASKIDDGFEVVPAPQTDSSDSSSDESDDDDVDTKAEILAHAKKMLTKKQREEMIDDAYNKYMFHDEGLPKWFLDEEKMHRVPVKPVTPEEIRAMKAQFKEINARPAKKVAEAKARKKRAAFKKLEKVRKRANTISDQADISDRSKSKMIDQLYKKATATKKPQKEYVVAKKGVQVKGGKGKVVVDRRMKKDLRKKGASKQGKDKKGGKAKGKGPSAKSSGNGKGKKKY